MMYLVFSNEHNAWWRANRCGYTRSLEAAGRYTREEAITICALSRDGWDGRGTPSEIPVPEEDALQCQAAYVAAFAVAANQDKPETNGKKGAAK